MEVENEIWKDISGYPGYKVSSLGRVKSLKFGKERILKPAKDKKGYLRLVLCNEGIQKTMKVHRLVGQAFIQNQYNLPQINHKNEIKDDNRVENLEWCDNRYNCSFGTHTQRVAKAHIGVYNTKTSKKVKCLETGKIYPSLSEVQRQFGFAKENISACCKKKYGHKTVGNYHWEYVY